MPMKLCSACLLGVRCRYDGQARPHPVVQDLAQQEGLIPICPEQLGGLPTPRVPAEIQGDRVLNRNGLDVTAYFQKGAEEVLRLARQFRVTEAIFKQRSPSCASGWIYDGRFSGRIVKGDGVTTRLLKQNGIKVISDDNL